MSQEITAPQITVKTCSKCKIEKSVSLFSKDNKKKDGLCCACKACIRAYRQANFDKIAEQQRTYNKKNSEKISNQKKIYRKLNADRLCAYHKNYAESQKNVSSEITGRICCKCNEYKLFSEFTKAKYKKYGVNHECKKCVLKTRQTPEEREKQHRRNRTEKSKEYVREYQKKNSEKLTAKSRRWRENNIEKVRIQDKEYRAANADRIREYNANRVKNDPIHALKKRVKCLIRNAIVKKGYLKKTRTHDILGCDSAFFMQYLESKFTDGMSFENKGEWELDHIIPLASAKTEDDVIRLNHYTNLQPLWAIDNKRKSDKMPPKHIQNKIALAYAKATGEKLKQTSIF